MRRWTILPLVAFIVGCGGGTAKFVRLETGQGEPIVHVLRRDGKPVEVSDKEFKQAVAEHIPSVPPVDRPLEHARQWFGVSARSGWFRYEGRSQRLMASEPGSHENLRLLPADEELKRRYLLWCERTWGPGDCLRLLVDRPFLDGDGKYALAMAIAHGKVLGAMKEELGQLVSPQAVVATVVGGLTLYAVLLALPEPVTKGVAALLTLGAMAYLGWDTVWRLIDGWLVLMKEVDRATTFDGIYVSGEKFGGVMGAKAARAFVMLATVAMGNTVAGMAAALPQLPGAGQAAVVAETQLSIRFAAPALAQVESVALSAEGVTIALAPPAVAMTARDTGGAGGTSKAGFRAFKSMGGFKSALGSAGEGKNWHHIVEQTRSNVERFGPEALHNTENVIAVEADVHMKISAYYSSKQKFTGGMVVREWLRTKSYAEQREFGLQTLRQFGVIP
ncbi:hypothetical protein [Stigmatella erecta]|uniref:Lipoprotein n=1 Tax=Stigmatella erecta TaxID=83460 RepID=A0A1I0KCD8_9BACT|nr:hypothetical protein [Stigmatella erecta]SEU21706.1 hypothetical protein SAMN05443639_11041 [Stigmatella erecta]